MYVKIIIVIMEVLVPLTFSLEMQNVNVQLIIMERTVNLVIFFKYNLKYNVKSLILVNPLLR
jgi:hypothetical protein